MTADSRRLVGRRVSWLIACVLSPAVLFAQGPPSGRGAVPPSPGGTAVIRGRVIASDTKRPLRGARLQINAPELATPRNYVADVNGRFEIGQLAAGRYTITASAPGFVALSYGQTRPFEVGRPVALGNGQVLDDVTLSLPRGGAIAGIVLGETGRPLINADVTALRPKFVRGVRQFEVAGRGDTNDLGEYRIYSLTPGRYFVAAAKRFSFSGRAETETGYPPLFFPGTHNAADARTITVAAGQTAGNINFNLDAVGSGSVAVVIKAASGQPPRFPVAFLRLAGSEVSAFFGGIIATLDLQAGRVVFLALPAGEYVASTAFGYGTQPGPPQAGSVKIQVNGNVGDVALNAAIMQTASGRIVFDGADGARLQPSEIKLGTLPSDPAAHPFVIEVNPKDDLTFALPAPAGRQLVRPTLPPGWGLKAVRLKGEDVIDSGVEFGTSQNLDDLEIELTKRLTTVTGGVRNEKNEPVSDFTVVVYSRERQDWNGDSRSFAIARPDQAGAFTVSGLKAGDYYAAALEYLDPGEAQDPALLTRLQRDAASFTLAEAESKSINLRLVR